MKNLLAYTKINQLERPLEAIDANGALSSAPANLAGAIAESGAKITGSAFGTRS